MTRMPVLIDTIEKVKQFVQIVSGFPCEMDLSTGRYTIDAKSIMGIFSLDISAPLDLIIHDEKAVPSIREALDSFLIKEPDNA
ncbi:MAG: HPr family phosphocarrier protein [Clostridiales bacterium]|nr:HPr family phosphocarrier protein [Clostridiales bacterium]